MQARHDGVLQDRSGVAAVEFAMIAPVLFFLLTAMLDFGYAFNVKLKITSAVTAAGQYAFQQGQSVSEIGVEQFLQNISSVVLEMQPLSTPPSVAVLFNNSPSAANAANYYCLTGSPATWRSTGSKSASCGGLVTSGQFVTITVSGAAHSFFFSNPVFGSLLAIDDSVTVRIQ